MPNLGFDRLVTFLVPGFVVSMSFWLLGSRFWPDGPLRTALSKLPGIEWQFTIYSVVTSCFFGAVLRSLQGLIEAWFLDSIARKALGLGAAEYDEEWDRYIDHLEHAENSYISDLAISYYFDSRAALAMLCITAAYAAAVECASSVLMLLMLGLSGLLGLLAQRTHFALAERRHRNFNHGVPVTFCEKCRAATTPQPIPKE